MNEILWKSKHTSLTTLLALLHHTELLQIAQIIDLLASLIDTGSNSVLQKVLEERESLFSKTG